MRREVLIGIVLACLVFLSFVDICVAQPIEEWNKTFGGIDDDEAYSVKQTSDGGYILAGFTSSYGAGSADFWLVKTDSSGDEQWNKTFGGTDADAAYSVQQTSDGGYILTGLTDLYSAGGADFWLVKIDSSGDEQWNKTFGGTDDDGATSVQQTSDGGYILAGSTWSYGAGSDFWLVKTDSSGDEQWNKTFGGTDGDGAPSVQQTSDGGYILAGYTKSYGAGSADFWLVKTDSSGDEQWNKTFGGTDADVATSVQQTSDGGYILVGYTKSYGAGSGDFWLVKTDSSGDEQWNKTFGGTAPDAAPSVQQTSDGGYILAGGTWSYGAGSGDFWLVKTDSNGDEQWNKTFGGTSLDSTKSVQQTSDGGYILVGYTKSYGAGSGDFWLIKLKDPFNYQGKYVIDEDKLSIAEKNAYSYVQKHAIEQKVSPALLMAVIKQESNFNPSAIGDGGLAIGYMQLHWDAAYDAGYRSIRGFSKAYAEEDWSTDGLDPDTNIKYGCGYLRICYEKCGSSGVYDNSLKNTISAYNRGWPSGPSLSNKNTYVDPILGYYEEYKAKYIIAPAAHTPIPGFEVAFAVAGLLAVAYLLRRRK